MALDDVRRERGSYHGLDALVGTFSESLKPDFRGDPVALKRNIVAALTGQRALQAMTPDELALHLNQTTEEVREELYPRRSAAADLYAQTVQANYQDALTSLAPQGLAELSLDLKPVTNTSSQGHNDRATLLEKHNLIKEGIKDAAHLDYGIYLAELQNISDYAFRTIKKISERSPNQVRSAANSRAELLKMQFLGSIGNTIDALRDYVDVAVQNAQDQPEAYRKLGDKIN